MKFKVLKVTEEGHCEKCGRPCPRRRVLVQPLDAEGNPNAEPQAWGVNCAAEAKYGKKTPKLQQTILFEAENAERERALTEKGWLDRVVKVGEPVVLWVPGMGRSFLVEPPTTIEEAKSLANRKYNSCRASLVGSYFAQRGEVEVVRVDGLRAGQAKFFESQGFVRVSEPVEEAI